MVKRGCDCANCLSFAFKQTDQMCDISLPVAGHYKYLTELLAKPVQSEAKQCRPVGKAFIVVFIFFFQPERSILIHNRSWLIPGIPDKGSPTVAAHSVSAYRVSPIIAHSPEHTEIHFALAQNYLGWLKRIPFGQRLFFLPSHGYDATANSEQQ